MQSFNLIFSSAFLPPPALVSPLLAFPSFSSTLLLQQKYKIYVLFTLKIYSDLIGNFSFSFTVPSVAFFSLSYFHSFFETVQERKKEKGEKKNS